MNPSPSGNFSVNGFKLSRNELLNQVVLVDHFNLQTWKRSSSLPRPAREIEKKSNTVAVSSNSPNPLQEIEKRSNTVAVNDYSPNAAQVVQNLPQEVEKKSNHSNYIFWILVLCGFIVTLLVYYDFSIRMDLKSIQENLEIEQCSRQYMVNRCHPEHRVPLTEKNCFEWELCISKGGKSVSRMQIIIEIAIDYFNIVSELLSIKSLLIMFGIFIILNYTKLKY
jgi:Di-sulfide bridge nucleocytoplasmic transport domain